MVLKIQVVPGDIEKMRNRVQHHVGADDAQGFLTVLNNVFDRAKEAHASNGKAYAALDLVTKDEAETLAKLHPRKFVTEHDPDMGEAAQIASMERVQEFVKAASRGCVFLDRQDRALHAYKMEFEPGPGHVLLDATADLTGMTALMAGMEHVDVPAVDFSNLDVVHVRHPKRFKYVTEIVKKAAYARPYAQWIKDTVIANTKPGERALVIAHMAMFDHEYLDRAEDPEHPADWEGRLVSTLHWGVGIGTNKYADIPNVFLFSEFFVKRALVVSDAHAWSGNAVTDDALDNAVGRSMRGDYLTVYDGHLLRWTKQLACRGSVRDIQADGTCGKMRLFTTMDIGRLLRNHSRMFPGATMPTTIKTDGDRGSDKKVERFLELLATSSAGTALASDEVERNTGLAADDLKATIKKSPQLQAAVTSYGWRFTTGKQLGLNTRKRAYLVRDATR